MNMLSGVPEVCRSVQLYLCNSVEMFHVSEREHVTETAHCCVHSLFGQSNKVKKQKYKVSH